MLSYIPPERLTGRPGLTRPSARPPRHIWWCDTERLRAARHSCEDGSERRSSVLVRHISESSRFRAIVTCCQPCRLICGWAAAGEHHQCSSSSYGPAASGVVSGCREGVPTGRTCPVGAGPPLQRRADVSVVRQAIAPAFELLTRFKCFGFRKTHAETLQTRLRNP